ncbi:MAG: S6e family ribosomal protein [archaeon]
MVETNFKLVIGDSKTKRTYKAELKSPDADQLYGKKVGETFRGELIGLQGFELQITGGTDRAGIAIYKNLEGMGRRRLLLRGPPNYHVPKKFKGKLKKKTVRANTIANDMVQVNCKITKWGTIDLMKHFNVVEKPKEEKSAETKPAEAPKTA